MPAKHNNIFFVSFLQLTFADILFFDFCNSFLSKGEPTVPEPLKKFPLLEKHYNRVLNVPEINAWITKRPKSELWASDVLN